jgi:hypothetical protein
LKWRLACRVLTHGIGLAGVAMVALGLMSGRIRSFIPILIDRQLARAWPFTYVVVGDSLAAECPWKWSFGLSPVAVANLAVAGSDIRGITHQLDLAHHFRPQVVLISGGINDLINYEAPLDAIRYDFALLLRHLGKEQKSVVTLIPYISDLNLPSVAPEGQLRMIRRRDDSGRLITEWAGNPKVWMAAFSGNVRRVTRFRTSPSN